MERLAERLYNIVMEIFAHHTINFCIDAYLSQFLSYGSKNWIWEKWTFIIGIHFSYNKLQ